MPKRKITKAIKFSLLPITAAKRKRLELISENFREIYNTAAARLPSLQGTTKFGTRKALNRLRIELHPITHVKSQIAQEAIESARANYAAMESRKKDLRTTIQAFSDILEAHNEKYPDTRNRTRSKLERKIRRNRRALRTKYPTLSRHIIRIHNQSWQFQEENGRIYVVVPGERIGARYAKIWLPLKESAHYRDIINSTTKWGVGQLDLQTDTFITSITTTIDVEDYVPTTFVGVDLGGANLATIVVVQGDTVREVRLWGGREIDHIRNRFVNYRRRLQAANRLDLVRLNKGREQRWMQHTNHVTSYHIARIAAQYNCPFVAFEELHKTTDGLRWNSYQLRQMIAYKLAARNVRHITLFPSRKVPLDTVCSECGHADTHNRDGQTFRCLKCGYQVHAGVNTAKNIARRGREVLETAKKNRAKKKNGAKEEERIN